MSNWQHNEIEFTCTANDLLLFIYDFIMYDSYPIAKQEYETSEDYPNVKYISSKSRYSCCGLTWNILNLRSLYRIIGVKYKYRYDYKDFHFSIVPLHSNPEDTQEHDLFPIFEAGEFQDAYFFEENGNMRYLYNDNINNLDLEYKVRIFFNVRGYCPPYELIIMMAQRVPFRYTWYTRNDMSPYGVKYIVENHNLVGYMPDEPIEIQREDGIIEVYENKNQSEVIHVDNSFDDWYSIYTPLDHAKALEFNKRQYNTVSKLLNNERVIINGTQRKT